MSKNFFTADQHFFHWNMNTYASREFKTLEDMNETMIRNHNARVKEEDNCFHIGDFIFRNSKGGKSGEGEPVKVFEFKKRLNGNNIFIGGNHCHNNGNKTPIESLVIRYAGKRINLVHNPDYANLNYEINLVGHVHNLWKFKRIVSGARITDCINVGVDVNNFMPRTFEELYGEYCKWKKKEGLK